MNKKIVISNLEEAANELEAILARLSTDIEYSEDQFQVNLEHVYHHLNTAWNIRHTTSEVYANMTDDQFNEWSKFPKEMQTYSI
jgi:hypothetical protein